MTASSRGRFITLEGIEGAGKSTLAQHVLSWLQQRQIPAVLTREPGGTPLAERLRELVLTRGEPLPESAETLLMFAARSVHIANLIAPSLAAGTWVVCDRFTDASRAYQGGGRGIDGEWIETLARHVQGTVVPDCTLLLDLPVALGLARARQRAGASAADRFEALGADFFARVRDRYLQLARAEPARFAVLDASAPESALQAQAEEVLQRLVAATPQH